MLAILPHLIWAGVILHIVHVMRAFAVERSMIKSVDPLAAVVVPEDLVAMAMVHSEVWAQEDTLKAIRERYEQLQDWNRVRSAFGIGSMG
jgi:hypothetical protein